MTSENTIPTFVVVLDNEKPVFINLSQIAIIRDLAGGMAKLGMSNGDLVVIHGGEAIRMLINLLSPHIVTLTGQPLGSVMENTPSE